MRINVFITPAVLKLIVIVLILTVISGDLHCCLNMQYIKKIIAFTFDSFSSQIYNISLVSLLFTWWVIIISQSPTQFAKSPQYKEIDFFYFGLGNEGSVGNVFIKISTHGRD